MMEKHIQLVDYSIIRLCGNSCSIQDLAIKNIMMKAESLFGQLNPSASVWKAHFIQKEHDLLTFITRCGYHCLIRMISGN